MVGEGNEFRYKPMVIQSFSIWNIWNNPCIYEGVGVVHVAY